MLLKYLVLCLFVTLIDTAPQNGWAFVGNPLWKARPCEGNDDVLISGESGRSPEEENQYGMHIKGEFPRHSKIVIQFDADASLTLTDEGFGRVHAYDDAKFVIQFYKSSSGLGINVQGTQGGAVPHPTSIVVNTVEYCKEPVLGILDGIVVGKKTTAISKKKHIHGPTCGRRQVDHTELITNSLPTNPGDWPWHAAIYKVDNAMLSYICGGTLISETVILTAAHCTTRQGRPLVPEALNVVLGKFNLAGGDLAVQDQEIIKIVVHEDYNLSLLRHDISLLKLKSEVKYGQYVQPACLWEPGLESSRRGYHASGTVVGWGFDHTDHVSSQLRKATVPIIPESQCLRSNPVFFEKLLTEYNFCGGYRNGTSACNGDSGGGMVVFLSDHESEEPSDKDTGAWFVRGIVSVGVKRRDINVCDPYHYVLFTDVSKYANWIKEHSKL